MKESLYFLQYIEDFDNIHIQVKQSNHTGGFVVKPKDEPTIDYEDFGKEVRLEDFDGIGE